MSAKSPLNGDEFITLIGAGPVGSLLAVFLAQKGWQVDLFERRPDMRTEVVSAGRSINLAVSTRGLYALEQIGLAKEILQKAVAMRGRMIHSASGQLSYQPYGIDDSYYINSISRAELNKTLISAAEKTERVRLHFNKRALQADLDAKILRLKNEQTGATEHVHASLVIGTDGSASAIRNGLCQEAAFACQESFLDYGYKELHIPPGPGGSFSMKKNALHIWPRGTYMLIALPNHDGSYTCTLFLPFEGPVSFAELSSAEKVNAFFAEQFPDALALIENLAETFFANPTGHMSTIKLAPWYSGGQALLVGDAAHAIVPFFGQGMNCGFEDCTVLNECFTESIAGGQQTNWPEIFKRFFELRKPHTDAIADMAVENFVEMRDKVANKSFLMQKSVEKILQEKFPGRYYSRYALVTFSRTPYNIAAQAGVIVDEILQELCCHLEDAVDVDLSLAESLISNKLSPFLIEHQQEIENNRLVTCEQQ